MASQSLGESLVLVPAQRGIIAAQKNSHDVSVQCAFAGGDKQSMMDGPAVSCLLRFATLTIAFCSHFSGTSALIFEGKQRNEGQR